MSSRPCKCVCVLIASSHKDPGPVGLRVSPSGHIFSFTTSLKILVSKYSPTLRPWGFRTSTYECQHRGTRVQPLTGYLALFIFLFITLLATGSGKQTHSEGQCRSWSAVEYAGGPKAESPFSQGPRPAFMKTLYTLSVPAQTHLPKFPETSLNKGKERCNQS